LWGFKKLQYIDRSFSNIIFLTTSLMQKIATTLPFLLLPFFIWAQTLDLTLDFDNEERSYVLHIPPTYVATESVPLVIALHGLTNSGTILMESSQFDLVADTANFIVAFPTALNNGLGQTAWNNGLFVGSDADDTGFLMELIAVISNEYSIDANRVYFTGFSMGGFMSNRMACEFADEITAIASHSGTIAKTIIEDCEPSRLMPMMHIHGNSDPVVGYDGNWLTGLALVKTILSCCYTPLTTTATLGFSRIMIFFPVRKFGTFSNNILWLNRYLYFRKKLNYQ